MPPRPTSAAEKRYADLIVTGEWVAAPGVTLLVARSVEIRAGAVMNAGTTLREIRTDRLVMHAGAAIRVSGAIDEFRLTAGASEVSGKCLISGRGASPGDDGVDMKIYLGLAKIDRLTISTAGARGAAGGKGTPGANGHKGECITFTKPTKGRPGGKGKTGGRGGHGGNVVVAVKRGSPTPKRLEIDTQGGPGGPGGPGGTGGKGGGGSDCGFWGYGRAASGPPGPGGDPGPEGDDGDARFVEVESFTRFEDLPHS